MSIDLTRADTPRRLRVLGGQTYTVPAPSVKTAFFVLVMMESDDPNDIRNLRKQCVQWLGLEAFSVLFSDAVDRDERDAALMQLVFAGLPGDVKERFEQAADENETGTAAPFAESSFWMDHIMTYRMRTGASWQDVMGETWGVFLSHILRLDMLDAKAAKDIADGYVVVKADDDGEAYEAMANRAAGRGEDEAVPAQDDGQPDWAKTKEGREEWYQKKRAELYRVQQAMTNRSADELPRN